MCIKTLLISTWYDTSASRFLWLEYYWCSHTLVCELQETKYIQNHGNDPWDTIPTHLTFSHSYQDWGVPNGPLFSCISILHYHWIPFYLHWKKMEAIQSSTLFFSLVKSMLFYSWLGPLLWLTQSTRGLC